VFRELDMKMVVIIVIVALFYLRLFMIRGRKRKEEREIQRKLRSKGKKIPDQKPDPFRNPRYQVASWWIIIAGIFFFLLGVMVATSPLFPTWLRPYDWLFLAVGGILFIFSFK
jgi:hypothetical protein